VGGYIVPALNLPAKYSSDAGHALCNIKTAGDFAAVYQDVSTTEGLMRIYSLRSNGFDVSAIAKQYGGGGHRKAAGFKIPLSQVDANGNPLLAEHPSDIEWDNPLEEAQTLMARAQELIAKAMTPPDEES
jgi:nanoRNase/pAp phosphatase (c-di-AMP/oligoRNAs hydrolase)